MSETNIVLLPCGRAQGSVPRWYYRQVSSDILDKIELATSVYKWKFETACSWQGVEPRDVRAALGMEL